MRILRSSFIAVAALQFCVHWLDCHAATPGWAEFGAHKIKAVTPRGGMEAGFTLLPASQTGIQFTNFISDADQNANHNLLNGAGVALGDVDGDGLCDMFLVSTGGSCALYRNKGNWQFEDITDQAGVALTRLFAHGAALADVDGDGDLDLVVTLGDLGIRLLLNDGKGKFAAVTNPQFVGELGSSSVAMGDVDRDGDLDLYVANYGARTLRSGAALSTTFQNGREVIVGRWRNRVKIINGFMVEFGEPDRFFLNDGKGQFRHVPFNSGSFFNERGEALKADFWDMGLSVMIRDINQDGLPDIYVCNDFQGPDRIWINKGAGKFQLIARHAIRSSPHFSMGVDFGDLDRDGWDDFMVVDMLSRDHKLRMTQLSADVPNILETLEEALDRPQVRRNMLYWNRGDGTFAETAFFSGVEAADWAWCPVFIDVDLDGYEDILVTNGHAYDTQDMDAAARNKQLRQRSGQRTGNTLSLYPPLATPNNAFKNLGGLKFAESGDSWGFNSKQVSHGIALGDLDNDGDLDVVVSSLNAPALVYRNESNKPRLAVHLKGQGANSKGIGARITVRAPGLPDQAQEVMVGGRYVSSDQPIRAFAALKPSDKLEVRVRWRSGSETTVRDVPANSILEISEQGAAPAAAKPDQPAAQPLFAEKQLNWAHMPDPRNDFEFQPLLPQRWSSSSPSAALLDLNGDKAPDILISGNPRQPLQAFINDGAGKFASQALGTNRPAGERNLVLPVHAGGAALVVTAELPTPGRDTSPTLFEIFATTGASRPLVSSNILWGALASADVDGDGFPEVFAGARLIPGKYPARLQSLLIPTAGGSLDAAKARRMDAGIVTGAVFADFNGDGKPDLAVASDLGPVRVFLNVNGELVDRTKDLQLDARTGFWSSIAAADVDHDGKMDIVAGNLGLNSMQRAPWLLYHGDFDQNTITEIFPATTEPGTGRDLPVYALNALRAGSPLVAERFPTHTEYAAADMKAILGESFASAKKEAVTWTASTVFLNRGAKFEAVELPFQAQLSPVFGIAAADFDGDGHLDLALAQNFFGTRPDEFRMDSGRGLVLRGDGKGGFTALSAQESGVEVYGEQRAALSADFNNDQKPDLLILEHAGRARLFENQTAR